MENSIQKELDKIIEDYDTNDDFQKTNALFIDLIKKSNHNAAVIREYLLFVYPLRNQDDEMNKNCVALCEEVIQKSEVIKALDYLKLGAIYGELEDYENEVKWYLEAEKHIEKKGKNKYADIAWYYDEIAKDYPKAIEYYKKYLEHNRVWFGGNKEKAIALIKEIEEDIKRNK